jgi:hypothetical protein
LYGLSISDNGLAFIPSTYLPLSLGRRHFSYSIAEFTIVIFGALIGLCLVLVYASFHSKALAAGKCWSLIEEYRRLPLACVGALSYVQKPNNHLSNTLLTHFIFPNQHRIVVALFWLGWTSYGPIHPALPMMAGIFFGFGYLLVFAAMLNYLTDAYKEASACAQAAASATRAIMAVVLPFATTPMYTGLGIQWASSLLGFLAFALTGIPFAFIRYGQWMRRKSGILVE